MSNSKYKIWLRHETKAKEQRVTLTPEGCKDLLDAGYEVTVEKSPTRIIPDGLYKEIDGIAMVESNAWRQLPYDPNLLVVGLKELATPKEHQDSFIVNHHTYFAHCYKEQDGWKHVLGAYKRGVTGVLYDYEFLWNQLDLNVGATMSPFAGFVGAAQGIRAYCWQQLYPDLPLPPIVPSTKKGIIFELKGMLENVKTKSKTDTSIVSLPKVMIMGALGRCGSGAKECAEGCGLETIDWDIEETRKGGPFPEILDAEIFVNCILLRGKMPPFFTLDTIDSKPDRKLRVIADVSCDPTSEYNPIPVYDKISSWEMPALTIRENPPLQVISVDNLPSVLAEEASYAFNDNLLPLLLDYPKCPRWGESEKIFREKMTLLDDDDGDEKPDNKKQKVETFGGN